MAQIYTLDTKTDGTAHYTFRTTLDGSDYLFELDWSTREERWYLSLYDVTGALLCGRVKLVPNWPLLRYVHHRSGMPSGELAVVTSSERKQPPGLYELGPDARCELVYITEDEL